MANGILPSLSHTANQRRESVRHSRGDTPNISEENKTEFPTKLQHGTAPSHAIGSWAAVGAGMPKMTQKCRPTLPPRARGVRGDVELLSSIPPRNKSIWIITSYDIVTLLPCPSLPRSRPRGENYPQSRNERQTLPRPRTLSQPRRVRSSLGRHSERLLE